MSVKSSIVIGLAGGVVGFGVVLGTLMHSKAYRQLQLEIRPFTWRSNGTNNLAAGEREYRQRIADWTQLCGADYSETLRYRVELASILEDEGKKAESEAEFRSALTAIDQSMGAGHPFALNTRERLASLLLSCGKLAEEEEQWRIILHQYERMEGMLGKHTIRPRNYLIRNLNSQGKYSEEIVELQTKLKTAKELGFERRVPEERMKLTIQTEIEIATLKREISESKKRLGQDDSNTKNLELRLRDLEQSLRKPRSNTHRIEQ
jgi:hypothetical protein